MDGVIATNTTISRDAVKGMKHAEETGGLSGKPVLEASNNVIRQLRGELGKDFPIIGVGARDVGRGCEIEDRRRARRIWCRSIPG